MKTVNPNYAKPSIDEQRKYRTNDIWTICFDEPAEKKLNKVKSNGKESTELKYKDLLICSPTVLGFSLNDKLWCKFLDSRAEKTAKLI